RDGPACADRCIPVDGTGLPARKGLAIPRGIRPFDSMDGTPGMATARIEAQTEGGSRVLRVAGRLDTEASARLWPATMRAAEAEPIAATDLAGLEPIDPAGAVLLLTAAPNAELRGTPEHAAALLERTRKALAAAPPPGPPGPWLPITAIGRATVNRAR